MFVSLSQKQEQTKKTEQSNYKKKFCNSQSESDRMDKQEFRHEVQAGQGPSGDTSVAETEESCRGGTNKDRRHKKKLRNRAKMKANA